MEDNSKAILDDFMVVMQIVLDRLDTKMEQVEMIDDVAGVMKYCDLVARRDAINSLKSYLTGRFGGVKLPIPDDKYKDNK